MIFPPPEGWSYILIKVTRYHWTAPKGSGQVESWLSTFAGLFLSGLTDLGESPAFDLWSGKTTAVTVSGCRDTTLRRIPRPLGGRLLDHFGLKIVLDGTMKVGEGAAKKMRAQETACSSTLLSRFIWNMPGGMVLPRR